MLAETPIEEPEVSDPLELQRDESLETPQAAAAREDSEYAYADLTAGGEADLLQGLFAPQLEAIDADPARALDEVTIERLDSPTEALVTLDGEKALLESEVPLRAPEEDGDLTKVELGLEPTPAGYEPANPLVDLSLPDSAQDPIGIGDEGLAITPVGTAASAATPIGGEDLLLPAAHEDTSLLLSPIAGGLELSAMLASRNSPQELAFEVTLPPGAALRAGESGGAEVVDTGGEPIATITAPHAVDAQGTEIPVALAVEGNTLGILVPHQELDVAYPLFVDPEIIENWSGFADTSKLGYWHWSWSGVAGAEDYIGRTSCIVTCWGNGLYVRARSNFTYPAGSWGRWWFTPQGSTTYMRRVILGPVNYDAHGCTANEPHGYIGVWNDSGFWAVRNNAFPSGWATSVDVGNLPPGTRTAFVGIHAESNSNLNCGRDYRLGGATLYLDDIENPTASATSGYPTGWIKSGTNFTINAPASDPGTGVYSATLSPGGSPPVEKKQGCDGHYSSACPSGYTFQFPVGAASFDEGEKLVKFSAQDPLGKPSNTYQWNLKVDRTPPEIELAGQLAQATDETEGDGKDDKDKPLPLPVYNLTVNTTDGVLNPSEGGQKRSGVKKIQVFIDNRPTPEQTWEASSCSAGNCPLSKVFVLKLNELSADTEHYLRVLATDFAGNAPRERKLEFEYIPATGMKDEYVMQYFPLPDGSGNEAEEEHPSRPELTVNLVSGNLLYRQEDLDVSGAAADLELELFYNSLLPEQQDTEWGDGWTLAQTPELEIEDPGAGPPSEATIVDESAMVESKVDLPASVGEAEFDKRLQGTVEKVAGGGYALTDESGESGETVSFDSSGKAAELTNGTAATVEYDYEGGDLSAITIEDPGTANADPEDIEEGEASPPLAFLHSANFGTRGSADGQFKAPADVATDPQGNVWVLDNENGRVEQFGPDGQLISKFGSLGNGENQLETPSAIALDASGNVLVADKLRVKKFSPSGELLAKFGPLGASGQFLTPTTSLAVGVDGSVWASDNVRIYRFSASGQLLEQIATSGPGQITSPEGIAVAPSGEVFIADPGLDKIKVYDKEGDYLRQFGVSGTAPGQLAAPIEVSIDPEGRVWVADSLTDRIQVFTSAGDYLAGFGATGSGAQQLDIKAKAGIAFDGDRIWVADGGNDRVAEWAGGNYEPSNEPVLSEDDPQLEVEVSEGLVDSVEGEESGTIDYQHSGDLLTAVDAPDGEAQFTYDSAGRMTKVSLANGTYGEVAYEATYGRVKSVTVAVEGKNPKTTYFSWSDEPHRTTVTPPDAPATTYDIAADGSIFKWWNAKQPPVFDDVAGTLFQNRETSSPISTGVHNLVIQAHDEEGVASIQVIANNNQLVDERTCDYDPEKPTECVSETNEWVTETANWPPGIVYLEVIATDRLGEASSQRFWVNIPYTPPPDPEAEEPPRFNDILRFREEHGLDLDLQGDEQAINDRIFESMGDWNNPMTPAGEVARATYAKWGAPLRAVDAAELEHRQAYWKHAMASIPQWTSAHAASSFAGFFLDERAGGKIRVGFTGGQEAQKAQVESLIASGSVSASDRIVGFAIPPQNSLPTLEALADQAQSTVSSLPPNIASRAYVDVRENEVAVVASNLSEAESRLHLALGAQSPLRFVYGEPLEPHGDRDRINSPMLAGDSVYTKESSGEAFGCSAGFGAYNMAMNPSTNQPLLRMFFLLAAHCSEEGVGSTAFRVATLAEVSPPGERQKLGTVKRTGWDNPEWNLDLDVAAVRFEDVHGIEPRRIFNPIEDAKPIPVKGVGAVEVGTKVCYSGAVTDYNHPFGGKCGTVFAWSPYALEEERSPERVHLLEGWCFDRRTEQGDSGGPVWIEGSETAVGIVSAGTDTETCFAPLLPNPEHPQAPSALTDSRLAPLDGLTLQP
ncbi:MAG TPA: DUF6531 domain-containing protein [Solirubrobacterales bacterium]|nr:DUF6531 domain-containing protein [Solirubrobacterales bacterium]